MVLKSAVCFLAVAAGANARQLTETMPEFESINDERFHDILNKVSKEHQEESTWTAGVNEYFNGMSFEDAKHLLGAQLVNASSFPKADMSHIADSAVPTTFSAITQWGSYIHPIRDQAQCGSCWAFAAAESLSDRFTIASKGSIDVVLSPQDMVSCDSTNMGCNGGNLPAAWEYLKDTGIVSDKCFPYGSATGSAPSCRSSCEDGSRWKKYHAKDYFNLASVSDIQKAIMTDGPVEVAFSVYKSFMTYKSGVYTKKWYELVPEGGHAVKAVGWGTEDGVDYWLIANSWNTNWGMDGFFKIKRGVNECGIEGNVYAGHPDLDVKTIAIE